MSSSILPSFHKLIAAHFVVFIESHLEDIAFGHFHIAGALEARAVHGADLRTQALAQVVQTGADGQPVFGESRLAAAIGQLLEDFTHGNVDGVAHQVGVQAFQQRFAAEFPRP